MSLHSLLRSSGQKYNLTISLQVATCYQLMTFGQDQDCKKIGPGPEVIKLFSCSTQLSTKFQLLIKTKIAANEVSCFKSLRCCIYHAYKC